jgi:hypothetical protein
MTAIRHLGQAASALMVYPDPLANETAQECVMAYLSAEGDGAAALLERRWFAAFKAASVARAECEALLEEMERVDTLWNDARIRLAELEALREALDQELAELDPANGATRAGRRADLMSAA